MVQSEWDWSVHEGALLTLLNPKVLVGKYNAYPKVVIR